MSPLHSPTRRPTATAWLARALLGVVLAAALPSPALAGELRQITLVDGRVIVGEVLATEADGLRMAVPQGELKLPLALLADMQNSDQRALAESEPWQIRVLPGPRAQAIAAAMASIDAVVVSTPPTPDGCAATDLACAVAATRGGVGVRGVLLHVLAGQRATRRGRACCLCLLVCPLGVGGAARYLVGWPLDGASSHVSGPRAHTEWLAVRLGPKSHIISAPTFVATAAHRAPALHAQYVVSCLHL